ncbi:MAG: UDP-N-acetylglucosamine--N-acetylmuramyl-(pentapeptide) pyrophosphoryl-undecaprenol N-acetylglucosamine transferase [Vampirovibrionales bacterium]|nr:UDP-N-acetylglucosamine--N-acetylmuramyl-(pentapeptide) pyrophosphoryl-undecaprenol N-acetylglucosamine transferase [Vampirovibrionales bacterium]
MNSTPSPWVVITGGGTGGHIIPALTIAKAFQAAEPNVAVTYVGKTDSMDAHLAEQHGIPFEGVHFYGMPRPKNWENLKQWLTWGWALLTETNRWIARFGHHRPYWVFATGGYVSGPVLLAALVWKIPMVLHEPDARPGLVNRLLGRFATLVTVAFSKAIPALHTHRALITGNPLRPLVGTLNTDDARCQCFGGALLPDTLVLLVMGGSQGARTLNRATIEALPRLLSNEGVGGKHWAVILQTGAKDYEASLNFLATLTPPEGLHSWLDHPRFKIDAFIEEMPTVLAATNAAVCRSGSMTLAELAVAGIPALLVPYPYAAADHQAHNALAVAHAGAARVVSDSALTAEELLHHVATCFAIDECRQAMGRAALALGHPKATETLVTQLQALLP